MCSVTVNELKPETNDNLRQLFQGHSEKGFCRVGDAGYILPYNYRHYAHLIKDMAVRPDDVWVITYPRSGTTWIQELIWLLKNDLNYDSASKTYLSDRFIFLEFFTISIVTKIENSYATVQRMPSPRFVKSHLALSLLPNGLLDTTKVVYVARDPRDVAVSFYHQNKLLRNLNYTGDFKTYWELFINDFILWTPYFDHVKEAWAQRNHPNMLFLFYEDMLKDFPSVIRRICEFYNMEGKYSDSQIQDLCDHLHIDNFRSNKAVNMSWRLKSHGESEVEPFIRKGKSGEWRHYFDHEMSLQAEEWLWRHLADTDLRFPTI